MTGESAILQHSIMSQLSVVFKSHDESRSVHWHERERERERERDDVLKDNGRK